MKPGELERAKFLLRLGFWRNCAIPNSADDEISDHTFQCLKEPFSVQTHRSLHKTPPSITLIILDWDDTLLCTSWVRSSSRDSCQMTKHLQRLENVVLEILEEVEKLGQLCIVTNASIEWLFESARRWLPSVAHRLPYIQVVSARDKFEKMYPSQPIMWKCEAFMQLKENSKQIANLIAIGDSEAEMQAIVKLAQLYDTAFTKTIKFQEHPSIFELIKQLELVTPRLSVIVGKAQNLRITLERKKA